MGRSIDQDVHAAFVEFRAKEDDKCLSVQCIYCQQIRAKNTSRQKQHLLECPGLQNQPNAPRPTSSSDANGATSNGYPMQGLSGPGSISNGINPQSTPMQNMASRPSLAGSVNITGTAGNAGSAGPNSTTPMRSTPKPKSTPKPAATNTPGSNLPAPPLDDVHAAFVEFRAKEEDKCLSVQCIYCNQIRAKNTSRQRQHLLECQTYQNVMKESIPANNLLHRFDENDIARSLSIPTPTLELDFRMSVKLNPKINVGTGAFGQRNWISFIGGQWAGRWGKGIVIPGGQDNQLVLKDLATRVEAQYLLQTADEPPAYITVKSSGWRTGPREILEKLGDPTVADTTPPTQYKFRLNIELESGDERYAFLNTCSWVGSGCRRGAEVIYDAYRVH